MKVDTSSEPLVSIVVPTYNSAATLGRCLSSIREQTHPNIELIVVDNNSADDTKAIAKQHTERVFNCGPERSAQRNYGVGQATGIYVGIIDSDMELDSEVVSACVNVLMEQPKTKGVVIPEDSFGLGFWAQCKALERSFYLGVDWMEGARFFSRDIYSQVGGYDETMVSGEDWDLSQRVAKLGPLARITPHIRHNEGRLKLSRVLHKKFYYGKRFSSYAMKNVDNHAIVSRQTSIMGRYKLFLSRPDVLFRNPLIGLGMLAMKTGEFAIGGAGFLAAKFERRKGK